MMCGVVFYILLFDINTLSELSDKSGLHINCLFSCDLMEKKSEDILDNKHGFTQKYK